jgi:thymidylate synthase
MINKIDKQYIDLLQDILDTGVEKETRNGSTLSVFGKQIRHKMSEGFPLIHNQENAIPTYSNRIVMVLTMAILISNILVDNDCHIWDGDAYKNYLSKI